MNSTMEESGDQKYWRIGRLVSVVSTLALVRSPTGAAQTFITPSLGASQEIHLPFQLTRAAVRLGLPNSLLRSISGAGAA